MKIAFLGDIALFNKYCITNNFDYTTTLLALKNALSDFDFVVANLEAPLTNYKKRAGSKSAYIRSEVNNVEILKYLGVDAVSLANNHIYDFGIEGLKETISILEEHKVEFFGVDAKCLRLKVKGEKIAIHGYCSYITDPSYATIKDRVSKGAGLNLLEYDDVFSSLKESDTAGYFNILSTHSGIENISIPSIEDIKFARKLTAEFDYIYYGHHPHVIQGVEKFRNSLISYSQGNCIFDDVYDHRNGNVLVKQSFLNSCSFILSVEIENKAISQFEKIPFSFYEGDFVLNCEKSSQILEERSNLLKLNFDDLIDLRKVEVLNMKARRSSKRNLSWFVSRLRLSTLFRILNNKVNSYFYSYKYKKFIEIEEGH